MVYIDRFDRPTKPVLEISQDAFLFLTERTSIGSEIEQGEITDYTAQLNSAERALLLEELTTVMRAYKRTCPT